MGTVNPVYIIGAGGFGRETLNVYRDAGREAEVAGFVVEDAYWKPGQEANGKPVFAWSAIAGWPKHARFVAAIGSATRGRLIDEAARLGFGFDTVIHPTVQSSPWVRIAEGCIVCAGNILTVQIDVGPHTIINLACTVGHDSRLGRLVTLSPGVNVSGHVTIGDGAFIGSGAVIIENITIGAGAVIGAGSVVTKDIPPKVLAVGVPARVIKQLA
jgi:sugar O-acyltransferase (sialic acid O-acetyltransferase NeuD family)